MLFWVVRNVQQPWQLLFRRSKGHQCMNGPSSMSSTASDFEMVMRREAGHLHLECHVVAQHSMQVVYLLRLNKQYTASQSQTE